MPLTFLDFEASEDTDGTVVFDAIASTSAAQAAEVQAEVDAVLSWARAHFPHTQGPLAEGFLWDHDVQHTREASDTQVWCTVSLSISAAPEFAQAFQAHFLPADD